MATATARKPGLTLVDAPTATPGTVTPLLESYLLHLRSTRVSERTIEIYRFADEDSKAPGNGRLI
jgi:hypothetical protein